MQFILVGVSNPFAYELPLFGQFCASQNQSHRSHPGIVENIAPVGGPGSDVIDEGIPP